MNACVKPDYRWNTVVALAGVEFVKGEYRPVPKGYEEEVKRHPFLQIEPVKKTTPKEATPKKTAPKEELVKE